MKPVAGSQGLAQATIEASLVRDIVGMEAARLRALARRAYQRGFRDALDLIRAEFSRRGPVTRSRAAA